MYPSWRQIDVPMSDFKGAKRKRCVSHFTLRWCPKNARWPKTLCELAIVWVWARRTIKIAYCFDVVSNTLRSEARLNSVPVGGPWRGVVLIHHMPGWDEWIKVRKEKASQRRTAGVAGRAALGVTYRWKAAAP